MKHVKILTAILLFVVGATAILCTKIEYGTATLNKFNSYEELKEFLETREYRYRTYPYSESYALEGGDYSKTNIQVEGVDEADIIKTDGEYIYVIVGQKIVIVKGYPAEEANVLAKISVDGTLEGIFINEARLVVFYENGSWNEATTSIEIYDVTSKENPTSKRKITVDGFYFNSRMIDNCVYVVIRKQASIIDGEVTLPKIYSNGECKVVPATDIYYSDVVDYGYIFTTVLAVNVLEDGQEPNDETVLSGWATNIYVSMENIYLALRDSDRTSIHRIAIGNGEISYVADGQVPGTVLNQFSMDEYGGYFRIATTSQMETLPGKPSPMLPFQNNIYILNMELETVSKLENIAPGETIHSARFMGDICYLVTFRKTDPLFVIDLSNPYNPLILGELEITGYSDYLHPYDESHVIGVGKETIAAEQGDFSWYQGVKISLFDVMDVTEPKELAKYEIGDRGTDSPVLSDHKAFLFDRERNILVIPVSVAKVNESPYSKETSPFVYGEFVWQGAYVFTVSLVSEEKIALRGTVTHIEDGNIYDSSCYITRALYIGDVLYTISQSKIKMNSLWDLSEISELSLNE